MFKQKYVLEVKGQEDRVSRFECDPAAPLGELIDANFTIRNILIKQLNELQEKDRPKEEKTDVADEKKCNDKEEPS